MNISDEIEKLHNLKKSGALSEEEYQRAKESLLSKNQRVGEKVRETVSDISLDTNMWAMFIHLSQLCGYVAPLLGLVVPIVLWQIKKNDSPVIDKHGKIVVNWIITELILFIICVLLIFIIIGIPLMFALGIVGIVFPIVGAVKANNGEAWRYPCSIEFFALDEKQTVESDTTSD